MELIEWKINDETKSPYFIDEGFLEDLICEYTILLAIRFFAIVLVKAKLIGEESHEKS